MAVGRQNIRSCFLVATLSALLLAPAADAVSVDDGFRATGSVRMAGTGLLTWDAYVASVHATDGDVQVRLRLPATTLVVYEVEDVFVNVRDHVGRERSFAEDGPQRVLYERTLEGNVTFVLDADQPGGLWLRPAQGALQVQADAGRVLLSPVGTQYVEPWQTVFARVDEVGEHGTNVRTPHTLAATDASLHTAGPAVLLASGGRLVLSDGTTLDLPGRHPDHVQRDPVTNSSVVVHESTVALLEPARVESLGAAPWRLASTGLTGTVEGSITWTGLTGRVAFEDDAADDPEVLELQGRFDVSGDLASGGAWAVRGEADRVVVDLEPLPLPDLPVVVGGLTVLGALVAALAYGRDLLALAVGRLTEPLTSRTRQDILRAVHERQPVGLPELQDATGLGRSTLRYHLRVLQSAHVLQTVVHGGRGRNATFMLNGGSLMFRAGALGVVAGTEASADAGADPVVGEALSAAATHPVRRALFQHLVRHGPSDPARLQQVAAEVRGAAVAASTVSYHLRVLTDAGLVRSRWEDGRKRYAAALADAAARRHQYEAYLHRRDWRDAVDALLPGPLHAQQVVDDLVRRGHPARRAEDAVRSLRRLAILEEAGDRIRVHAAVADALRGPT